jgi:hypothetical protein
MKEMSVGSLSETPRSTNASHSSGYGVSDVGSGTADGINVMVAVTSGEGVEVNTVGIDVAEIPVGTFRVTVTGMGDMAG